MYAKAYAAGLLSGPFDHSFFFFLSCLSTHRGHEQTKPDKTRADVIMSISAKLHNCSHPSRNTITPLVHQAVFSVCKLDAVNGALSAVDLVLVCIGRNHGHPHKHKHTQGAEVSDLSLHMVASKTRDEERAEGLRASCVTKTWSPCAMTTCTSSSGSEQLLFNGQSRTDHEAEMVVRQQLSYSHSPSDTRISRNFMCLKSQT